MNFVTSRKLLILVIFQNNSIYSKILIFAGTIFSKIGQIDINSLNLVPANKMVMTLYEWFSLNLLWPICSESWLVSNSSHHIYVLLCQNTLIQSEQILHDHSRNFFKRKFNFTTSSHYWRKFFCLPANFLSCVNIISYMYIYKILLYAYISDSLVCCRQHWREWGIQESPGQLAMLFCQSHRSGWDAGEDRAQWISSDYRRNHWDLL